MIASLSVRSADHCNGEGLRLSGPDMDPPDPEALVHLEMSYPTIKTPLKFETLRPIPTPYVSGTLSILSGGRRGNELQSSAHWVVGRSAAGSPQGQVRERIYVTSPVGGLEPP